MSAYKTISLKSFLEELETRLAALSADDLRGIIRAMARNVPPAARRQFLESLQPGRETALNVALVARLDVLLGDIGKLEERVRAALGNPTRINRVRGFDGEDNPYADFEPELMALLERCRAAFEVAQMDLARDAYAALFGVLALQDDYGFSLGRPASVEMAEEYARFLRAVVETAPPDQRAAHLLRAMRDLRGKLWDARQVWLQSVFDITALPLAGREALLDDLIQWLREGTGDVDDRWLREAVRLRRGIGWLGRVGAPRRRTASARLDRLAGAAGGRR